MRGFAFALGLFFSAALTCDEIGHCQQCASTKGNLLGNCRWCTLDNQCHTPGSVEFNPCSSSQDIISSAKCPVAPAPKTSFEIEEAIDMTRYSRAAYAETAEQDGCAAIMKSFVSASFTCEKSAVYRVNFADRNFTVLSYYGYDAASNRIVLAFRGSVNFEAVWEALSTVLQSQMPFSSAPEAMINPFFLVGAVGLTNAMGENYSWLVDLISKHPSAQVYVTGHSLGGAMASLVATDLAIKKIATPVLYTFGQPRTGNGVYAALVTKLLPRSFRVVNANDPVPHVPFCTDTCDGCNYGSKCGGEYSCCSLSGSDVHHSTEMWFPMGEYQNNVMCGFKECSEGPSGEDASCSNRYTILSLSLASHSGYWNALNGYCNIAPLGAQPNYEAIVQNRAGSGIPILFVGAGIAFLILLSAGLLWLRSRARKESQIVDGFQLLESFSVAT